MNSVKHVVFELFELIHVTSCFITENAAKRLNKINLMSAGAAALWRVRLITAPTNDTVKFSLSSGGLNAQTVRPQSKLTNSDSFTSVCCFKNGRNTCRINGRKAALYSYPCPKKYFYIFVPFGGTPAAISSNFCVWYPTVVPRLYSEFCRNWSRFEEVIAENPSTDSEMIVI